MRTPSASGGRANVHPGETVVDLGCGPGFCSLDLARIVGPAGRVVAVDSSERALAQLRVRAEQAQIGNLELIGADVTTFDISRWRPDVIFARWLLSFLPSPDLLIRASAGALSTGGRLVVMDYWNYLAIRAEPCTSLFQHVFRAVHRSFADAGGSLEVAGEMPAAFASAGLRVTCIEMLPQIGRPGSPAWGWLSEFQRLYFPSLVSKGYLTAAELEEYTAWWTGMEQRKDAFFLGPPVLGIVGLKD